MQFWFDSLFFRIENKAPYALAGDIGGIYNQWTPAIGNHTLTAIPYPQANANGTAGQALTIKFNIIEITDSTMDDPSRVAVDGELKKWHQVTLTFTGPDLEDRFLRITIVQGI